MSLGSEGPGSVLTWGKITDWGVARQPNQNINKNGCIYRVLIRQGISFADLGTRKPAVEVFTDAYCVKHDKELYHMSENKDTDQLRSNCKADQRL